MEERINKLYARAYALSPGAAAGVIDDFYMRDYMTLEDVAERLQSIIADFAELGIRLNY